MTSEKITQSPGQEAGNRRDGGQLSSKFRQLLRRAPQFSALAKAEDGRRRELSRSQKEFLEDFSRRLVEDAAHNEEDSGPTEGDGRSEEGDETI